MFVAALFIIATNLKQSKCYLIGEWMKKLWYIQTGKYYSVLKVMSYQALKGHGRKFNAHY